MRMFLRNKKFSREGDPIAQCRGTIVITGEDLRRVIDSHISSIIGNRIYLDAGFFTELKRKA